VVDIDLLLSILVKTAWAYCKRLQNDGALNFVQFFSGRLCIQMCTVQTADELLIVVRQDAAQSLYKRYGHRYQRTNSLHKRSTVRATVI